MLPPCGASQGPGCQLAGGRARRTPACGLKDARRPTLGSARRALRRNIAALWPLGDKALAVPFGCALSTHPPGHGSPSSPAQASIALSIADWRHGGRRGGAARPTGRRHVSLRPGAFASLRLPLPPLIYLQLQAPPSSVQRLKGTASSHDALLCARAAHHVSHWTLSNRGGSGCCARRAPPSGPRTPGRRRRAHRVCCRQLPGRCLAMSPPSPMALSHAVFAVGWRAKAMRMRQRCCCCCRLVGHAPPSSASNQTAPSRHLESNSARPFGPA